MGLHDRYYGHGAKSDKGKRPWGDNGWSEEDKAIVCDALFNKPIPEVFRAESYEIVASKPRVRPTRNYRDMAGEGDE